MFNQLRTRMRERPRQAAAVGVIGVAVAFGAVTGFHFTAAPAQRAVTVFPQNVVQEQTYGVRFSRVAVVGDGGLVLLDYVVLDSEKASRFQSDVAHPPTLVSENRDGRTNRVSVMRQGHQLRTGQTYYFVYQNTLGALRSGEEASIVTGDLRLDHVPVL
ncbi:hypothetical protein SAMN04515671_4354 [Nakamurella panacisegetis]|uniref:Uncharacterized protein n=1 Tax=Nakamurella panacisegetis TaxID=1090615 RepID=A0A1H0SZ37_9ACTN|nr:hypothetical protein [Nakamurella panacisegetis]SDP46616.1 hypothetical protein SAMN04515671_4354 [Nakamurella panacisegetis]